MSLSRNKERWKTYVYIFNSSISLDLSNCKLQRYDKGPNEVEELSSFLPLHSGRMFWSHFPLSPPAPSTCMPAEYTIRKRTFFCHLQEICQDLRQIGFLSQWKSIVFIKITWISYKDCDQIRAVMEFTFENTTLRLIKIEWIFSSFN